MWNGRPCFTEVSTPTKLPTSSSKELGYSPSITKGIMTTIIKGALDQSEDVYESILKAFNENAEDISAVYNFYNEKNIYQGTHLKLVILASMFTCGDILEVGANEISIAFYNEILKAGDGRMVFSVDSDKKKIAKLETYSAEFHRFLPIADCKG